MMTAYLRRALVAGLTTVAIVGTVQPASALIVYDPTNYAQNVLQSARALQQINNQIQSLQNQATSLINQGKNLTSLPFSSLAALQAQVRQTQQLLDRAQKISFSVQDIEQAFAARYKGVSLSASDSQMVADAQQRWETSVGGFEDALKVQAGVVGNIDGARSTMNKLVSASQSATGALQAAQAGNQLLALQSQQIADLTAMMAAQGRAQSLEAARNTAAEAEGRERFRRFTGN